MKSAFLIGICLMGCVAHTPKEIEGSGEPVGKQLENPGYEIGAYYLYGVDQVEVLADNNQLPEVQLIAQKEILDCYEAKSLRNSAKPGRSKGPSYLLQPKPGVKFKAHKPVKATLRVALLHTLDVSGTVDVKVDLQSREENGSFRLNLEGKGKAVLSSRMVLPTYVLDANGPFEVDALGLKAERELTVFGKDHAHFKVDTDHVMLMHYLDQSCSLRYRGNKDGGGGAVSGDIQQIP